MDILEVGTIVVVLGGMMVALNGATLYMLWRLTKKLDEKRREDTGVVADNREPAIDSGVRSAPGRAPLVREDPRPQRSLRIPPK